MSEAEETIAIATRLFATGDWQRITAPGRRNLVLRLPGRAIAKRLLGADAGERFERELASLRAGLPQAPRLLAACAETRTLIEEDLGDPGSLVPALLGADPAAAEAALLAWATALGRAHAATAGFSAFARPPSWDRAGLPDFVSAALPQADIAALLGRIPGPFRAWTHRDPCPDNVLLRDGEALLIDFERSGSGFCLLDAAYPAMGFPSCWCAGSVPAAVQTRIAAVYRAELARGMPEAADDAIFAAAMEDAKAIWFLTRLAWLLPLALAENAVWGTATRRARLLHDAATVGAGPGGLAEAARRIGACLRALWPGEAVLPAYPAFSSSNGLPMPGSTPSPGRASR